MFSDACFILFIGEGVWVSVINDLHCRIRTGIPTWTRIPVLYKYYGKRIRVWIWTNVKSFCTVVCNHRVWNPSLSPNLNPSAAVEINHDKDLLPAPATPAGDAFLECILVSTEVWFVTFAAVLQSVKSESERQTQLRSEAEGKLREAETQLKSIQAKSKQLINGMQSQLEEQSKARVSDATATSSSSVMYDQIGLLLIDRNHTSFKSSWFTDLIRSEHLTCFSDQVGERGGVAEGEGSVAAGGSRQQWSRAERLRQTLSIPAGKSVYTDTDTDKGIDK